MPSQIDETLQVDGIIIFVPPAVSETAALFIIPVLRLQDVSLPGMFPDYLVAAKGSW
jgi:hypothetical protein